jgi:(2R)-ethylmalonyl-CoA mutase
MGVSAIYTPKDYALDAIMIDMARVIERSLAKRAEAGHVAPGRDRSTATPLL